MKNEKTAQTQCKMIKEALLAGRRLTPMEAWQDFGCYRLSARIWDLRHNEGLNILKDKVMTANGNKVAHYYIPTT